MAPISKAPTRPITQLWADKVKGDTADGLVVWMRVRCRTAQECDLLVEKVNQRRHKAHLISELQKMLVPPRRERDRKGELEPQIPRRLHDALKAKAAALGPRKQTALVKAALGKWIDFGRKERLPRLVTVRRNGKTIKKRRGFKRLNTKFKERGRMLAREPDLVRFTFNAGSEEAREAIEDLLRDAALTQTEFFSALIESICAPPEPAAKAE